MGRAASQIRNGLVKTADVVRAIFCGHSRDGTEPEMEGWAKIDLLVAQLSLKIESHSCGHSFRGIVSLVDDSGLVKTADPFGANFYRIAGTTQSLEQKDGQK